MRRTVCNSLFLLLAAIAFIGTTAAEAQPTQQDPVEIIQNRASNVVSKVLSVGSARTARFNAALTSVNLLRPLDAEKLDSANIVIVRAKLLAFLNFLGEYRDSSEIILHTLEDSIAVLRADMPRIYRETFLSKFLNAYTADMNAFDQFTLALSELYKEVVLLQSFIAESSYRIKDHTVQFADAATVKRYEQYMKELDKKNAEVAKAGEVPRETEKALQKVLATLLNDPNQ